MFLVLSKANIHIGKILVIMKSVRFMGEAGDLTMCDHSAIFLFHIFSSRRRSALWSTVLFLVLAIHS